MKTKKKSYIVLFLVACSFVIGNSLRTIYGCNNDDHMIFNTIGKFCNEGKRLYVDLFDHKGPIIFWINTLSWKMFDCQQGVLFFQIIAMFFTLLFLFQIAQLKIHDERKSLLLTIFTVLCLIPTYTDGNMTEEYCLPFITLSLYFNLKYWKEYIENKEREHDKTYAFVYGISFAVCFLTRLTNAVSICVGILMIGIVLLKDKKFKNLVENAIFFGLGFLLLFLPVALYFAKHHTFYEFLEGTILFNIKYVMNSISYFVKWGSKKMMKVQGIIYFSSGIILIAGLIKLRKEKNIIGIFYILLGVFETILWIRTKKYLHYAIICLPNIMLVLMEWEGSTRSRRKKMGLYVLLVVICFSAYYSRYKNLTTELEYRESENLFLDSFMAQIPENEKESFIAVDVDFRGIYEHYDRCPYYRYFVLQDFQASHSRQLYQQMQSVFRNGDVKWILFGGDKNRTFLKDILKEKYVVVDERENYSLYRIRQ